MPENNLYGRVLSLHCFEDIKSKAMEGKGPYCNLHNPAIMKEPRIK